MVHIDEWKLNYRTCFRTTREISASRLNSIKCDIVLCIALDSVFCILYSVYAKHRAQAFIDDGESLSPA